MLLTRVITAAVLLAVLTLSIYIGPFAFASVMAIAFGATLYEWLRIGGLGPRPALLVAAVEMVVQLSLYWAGALDRMNWFLMLMNGCVMLAWFVIFFAELFHRENGFKVSQRQCLWSAVTFVPAAYLSLLWLFEQGDWVLVLSVLLIVWGADILSESRTLLTCCPATAASSTAWTPRSPFCLPRPSSCCGSN